MIKIVLITAFRKFLNNIITAILLFNSIYLVFFVQS